LCSLGGGASRAAGAWCLVLEEAVQVQRCLVLEEAVPVQRCLVLEEAVPVQQRCSCVVD
jgi:hypothetical protein